MTVHMQGFAIQKLYQDGKVSEKGIFGNYDGKKAQIIAMDDGKVGRGTLSNHDIAALLSMRASPHSLVERLEDDLGRGHRHHHRTRHHRTRHRTRSHAPPHAPHALALSAQADGNGNGVPSVALVFAHAATSAQARKNDAR